MNAIEQIKAAIHAEFPGIKIEIDTPLHVENGGTWFLDIIHGEKIVCVEWRPNQGFGVSQWEKGTEMDIGYGEGPDQFYADQAVTIQAVRNILGGGPRE